jgi:hypothetical protein
VTVGLFLLKCILLLYRQSYCRSAIISDIFDLSCFRHVTSTGHHRDAHAVAVLPAIRATSANSREKNNALSKLKRHSGSNYTALDNHASLVIGVLGDPPPQEKVDHLDEDASHRGGEGSSKVG